MTKEIIISKIEKLLRLSKSTSEHEAALAMERASELMREHCISESMISAEDGKPESIDYENIHFPSNSKNWAQTLSASIARTFGCEPIFIKDPDSNRFNAKYCMRVFGTSTDRKTVQLMMDYAFSAVDRLAKKELKFIKKEYPWANIKKYGHNYRVGCTTAMDKTLRAIRDENAKEKNAQSQYGIILLDKAQRIRIMFKKKYPNTSNLGSMKPRGDFTGDDAGREDGSKVGFQKQTGGQSNKGLLAN